MNYTNDADHAYRVGAALAYLVKRERTFCTVTGADVALYPDEERSGLPKRYSAFELMKARGRAYTNQRYLYDDYEQSVLDGKADWPYLVRHQPVSAMLNDHRTAETACAGFVAELANR